MQKISRIVSSPVGNIRITGNDDRIYSIEFEKKPFPPTTTHGTVRAVDAAAEYIKAYFEDHDECISWTIQLVSEDDGGSTDPSVIRCDVTVYTGKEIAVYRALLEVGFGETVSYSELARRAGMNGAARFAGSCMAKNNFPLIIPCHRVIKADGSMGNFSGGVHVKEALLVHEARRHCDS